MLNSRNTLGSRGPSRRSILVGVALAAAAAALLVSGLAGQDTASEPFDLYGQVVDAQTGALLSGAWVGMTGTEWGSITNDEGRFRIPDLDPGLLGLTVELLGYETLTWRGDVEGPDEALSIPLTPQPVVLEGLRVMTDRFRSRRRAVATTVRAFEKDDLSSSASRTALEFVETYGGTFATRCRGRRSDRCFFVRGRAVEPTIYIDEVPVLGGLDYLESFSPWEFHMIEIFGGGSHIRAYTPMFMERVAKRPIAPIPIF